MIKSYADYEWFLKKDLHDFSGKWIAIIGKKVIADGKSVEKVIKEAKEKYPGQKPLVTKIKDHLSVL